MSHDEFERMTTNRQANGHSTGIEDADFTDTVIEKASAEQYERRGKIRTDFRHVNLWIAIGLYLVLAGVGLAII